MSVNTKKVTGRLQLKYASYEEVLADLDRLSSGPVKTLGNWSEGQIYRHLAIVMNGSIDGLPFRLPWVIRKLARLFKGRLLKGPMPPGFKLPFAAAVVMVPGPTTREEGLAQLRDAIVRLSQEPTRASHPAFGDFTKEQWDTIHLAHASLHMSFIVKLKE